MRGMSWTPRGFSGERPDPEIVKRKGWNSQGILVVKEDDQRLSWPERELIRQTLEKAGGSKTRAAETLGISRRALHYKLRGI